MAERPHPTLLEVTSSVDTVLWSVTMRKLGGNWERPTTKVTGSRRWRQEDFGKAAKGLRKSAQCKSKLHPWYGAVGDSLL